MQEDDPSVNPAHYQGDYVMRIIEDFGLDFCDGTVVKYLLRAGNKPGESALRDHRKALWYLARKIQQLQSANAGMVNLSCHAETERHNQRPEEHQQQE